MNIKFLYPYVILVHLYFVYVQETGLLPGSSESSHTSGKSKFNYVATKGSVKS